MVVEKNSEDSFNPGVEIAVIRDMEGGLLLVCSASGKWGKMMIIRVMENKLMMMRRATMATSPWHKESKRFFDFQPTLHGISMSSITIMFI